MRISWGYKIAGFYLAFVAGILFLVFKASNESFDLVTENYYEAELKYQDVIDQKGNTAQLSEPVNTSHTTSSLSLQLPKEFLNKAVEGEIYLYRASDAAKDLRHSFRTQNAFYQMNFGKELSGSYDLKLSWKVDGKQFYQEKNIFF